MLFAVLMVAGVSVGHAQSNDNELMRQIKETDRPAPIDWGYGPGVKPGQAKNAPAGTPTNAPKAQATPQGAN